MVLFGESWLRTAIHNFVAHYHAELNHQGLATRIITPATGHSGKAGVPQRRQRRGVMPNGMRIRRRGTPPIPGLVRSSSLYSAIGREREPSIFRTLPKLLHGYGGP